MKMEIDTLKKNAKKIRREIIEIVLKHGHTHLGGSFSIVEVLVALYKEIKGENDKIVISKGHGCLGLYPLLREKGHNPKIQAHPDIDEEEGISCTTGSLGHGLPICVGMAFAKKFKKEKGHIYVVMGDGECQEGTTWEALNIARRYKLDNLTIIVDYNKLQALGSIIDILDDKDLKSKFEAFGCNTIEIDGHDFKEILESLSEAKIKKGTPRAIIANTIKGKGLSFMENDPKWHTRMLSDGELKKAYKELK